MLEPESEQIREVYAFFGLAIHNSQCLEKELAMFLAASAASERFTAWDYDDRLAENFDSTFGGLVSMLSEVVESKHQSLLTNLRRAVKERNELIHGYFWSRSAQFISTVGRVQMLEELRKFGDHFDSIDTEVSKLTNALMKTIGVSQAVVEAKFAQLMSGVAEPHDPKRLPNKVILTSACEWKVGAAVKCGIIFTSDAGYLVLGQKGLCLGPQDIPPQQLTVKTEFAKALPATVNPKPKKAGPWNYVVQLTNGYELRVRPDQLNGKQVIRFGLRKGKTKARP